MEQRRIVSLLPSATELVYKLGAQGMLHGVTDGCTYPAAAAAKPRVLRSRIDPALPSPEIDAQARAMLKEGGVFELDMAALARAAPDLIITQRTCDVCAMPAADAARAASLLDQKPEVHSMDPHTLQDIYGEIARLGAALGMQERAAKLAKGMRARIGRVRAAAGERRPGVLAIEWASPPYTAGHWVPDMVEAAGGENLASRAGERSRPIGMDEIRGLEPDIIVLMPCGMGLGRAVAEHGAHLARDPGWIGATKGASTYAVDADSYFSRPGARTAGGVELLASIIDPGHACAWDVGGAMAKL